MTAREIAIGLKSRQNHATLLSTINVEKLVSILSKLPNVKNPIAGSVESGSVSEASSQVSSNQQSRQLSDKSSAESSEKMDLGATGPFEIPQVESQTESNYVESKKDLITEDSISEKSISEENSILSERPEMIDPKTNDSESKVSSEDEKSSLEGFDFSKTKISEKNPKTDEHEKPKKSNFDFLDDSDSDSDQKSTSKKSNDLLDFLSKPVETKTTMSAEQEKLKKINETIANIDDTNFDFLNSTDDENSFKPLDQKVKKTNFSFLDSDQSEDESEKNEDKSEWTKTDKTETQMSSDDDDQSEVSDKSESESENPFLKNLMAAQKAQNRSDSESSISSNYSEKSESKMFENSQLNNLSDDELDRVKEKMEKKFSANQLKPGDDGFEYDKQVDFTPTQDCEWDDSLAD